MKRGAHPVVIVLLVMWLVLIVDQVIPADLTQLGVRPRTLRGLIGIPLMPWLHDGFFHLLQNTIPLAVLLVLTTASRQHAWPVILAIALGGASLLWVVGRSANHVGASGLVFGLISYLLVVGFRERRFRSLGIALLVGFLFGGTLIGGMIPSFGSNVSWDGHLCGAAAGLLVGFVSTHQKRRA